MTIPPEFNEQEHLQSVVRQWINREVREWFQELGGEDWDPDITTPRGSLRYACTHQDTDNLLMTQMRWNLFDRIRLQKLQVPVYGIPVAEHQENVRFRPQIMLYFQEDQTDVDAGYAPVTGEISFRLMDHTYDTITPTIAQTYAQRINTEFANGGGYIWRKGKVMVTYTDRLKGYNLQIRCRNEEAGREVISKVLDIQNDTPDWERANVKNNLNAAAAYPTIPPTDRVYGDTIRLPRRFPVADIRFQYSVMHVWGRVNPVPLVDRTGLWPSALVA